MSLLFGRLTQNFVDFGSIITRANDGDSAAQAELPAAAASFRSAAASNAGYLTVIGRIAVKGEV
jgi:ATP-binding cassette subfamily B (MDR/TAP) protein 1